MKSSTIYKIKELKKRYKKIQQDLINPKTILNLKNFQNISREHSKLKVLIEHYKLWHTFKTDIKNIKILLHDSEMSEIAHEELKIIKKRKKEIEKILEKLLNQPPSKKQKNCFLEIRAGTGGNEAAIFSGNLFKMYYRYAESKKWKVEIITANTGEHGGYKEIIAKISGNEAYSRLKFESGGHRVQRIPETESQGRIHTSACSVTVLKEIPIKKIQEINQKDLRIDTFRSSGAGGQHVNTTDSAVRIIHIPTGIVVECQNERSQHKNKSRAMSILGAKIHQLEEKKRKELQISERRTILSSGDRSDRIRTYNFPQGRVTDHRIHLTIYRLEEVMKGELDIIINPIITHIQ